MKAITLWQPWASLVALGVKSIETRSWATSYRGPIAIHAAKWVPTPERGPMFVGDFHVAQGGTWLHGPGIDVRFPLGAIVATATLADVVPIVDTGIGEYPERRARVYERRDGLMFLDPTVPLGEGWRKIEDQRPYGDFTPGRYAWLLEDVKPTTERCPACWGEGHVWMPSRAFATMCPACDHTGRCDPIPAKGRQGLWNWEAGL